MAEDLAQIPAAAATATHGQAEGGIPSAAPGVKRETLGKNAGDAAERREGRGREGPDWRWELQVVCGVSARFKYPDAVFGAVAGVGERRINLMSNLNGACFARAAEQHELVLACREAF